MTSWREHTRAGRGIVIGRAYMFEMTRITAIEALCASIEGDGGQVISIAKEYRKTDNPQRKHSTIYTVVAIMPAGD